MHYGPTHSIGWAPVSNWEVLTAKLLRAFVSRGGPGELRAFVSKGGPLSQWHVDMWYQSEPVIDDVINFI